MATPPATESAMMVDVEMPEPCPLELLLLMAEVCEGADDESKTTTTLVTTWPP